MAFRGSTLRFSWWTQGWITSINWFKSTFHYGFDGLKYFAPQFLFQPPNIMGIFTTTTWVNVRFESTVFNDASYLDFVELGSKTPSLIDQGSLRYQPYQCHYCKGKSPQNYHRFASSLIPQYGDLKWLMTTTWKSPNIWGGFLCGPKQTPKQHLQSDNILQRWRLNCVIHQHVVFFVKHILHYLLDSFSLHLTPWMIFIANSA